MVPIIGMDCSPVRDLLVRHEVTVVQVARCAGLPVAVVHAVLDDRALATCLVRDMLLARAAVEALLPERLDALRHCWQDSDQAVIDSGRSRSP